MDEETKQALLDWAHEITAQVQTLLAAEGNINAVHRLQVEMSALNDKLIE